MRFVYFTKTLPAFELKDWAAWCLQHGLGGLDLAVRPGYPVTPDNIGNLLSVWVERLATDKLAIGLVTAPTDLTNPDDPRARRMFQACGKAGVPAVKLGYFGFSRDYSSEIEKARRALKGFERLAADTGVKALYHTHSGKNLGNNAAGQRALLEGLDPHHVGSFLDTGHLSLCGGPFSMELEIVKPWFSCLAIKDMEWKRGGGGWANRVVPAGQGIVKWKEVGQALKNSGYQGTISLHGEYELNGAPARGLAAAAEMAFLKEQFA